MALVIKRIHHGLMVLDDLQDPRTYGDFFVASPLCLIGLIVLYVVVFKKIGPELMKNVEPFDVKNAMIVYNVIQIVLNLYVFVKATKVMLNMSSLLCEPIDYSNSPRALEQLHISRIYMYLKIFDIGDTLFFLLRKSYRQISFLHMYHHTGMFLLVWISYKFYGGGGSGQWISFLNSFVHVVMFFYYLLTSIDSSWKNNLAFKRSLTQLQLVQFFIFMSISAYITVAPSCKLNKVLSLAFAIQNVFMFCLFGEFYYKSYVKPKKNKVT